MYRRNCSLVSSDQREQHLRQTQRGHNFRDQLQHLSSLIMRINVNTWDQTIIWKKSRFATGISVALVTRTRNVAVIGRERSLRIPGMTPSVRVRFFAQVDVALGRFNT
jgi:hypothetical protein